MFNSRGKPGPSLIARRKCLLELEHCRCSLITSEVFLLSYFLVEDLPLLWSWWSGQTTWEIGRLGSLNVWKYADLRRIVWDPGDGNGLTNWLTCNLCVGSGVFTLVLGTAVTYYCSLLLASLWDWDEPNRHVRYRDLARSIYGEIVIFASESVFGKEVPLRW